MKKKAVKKDVRKTSAHPAKKSLSTAVKLPLLDTLMEFRRGNFGVRMKRVNGAPEEKIADILNEILDIQEHNAKEIERVAKAVGREGKLLQRVDFEGTGSWKMEGKSVNTLIEDLARPTTEIVRVIGAVAKGDLSQAIETDAEGKELQGEFLRTAKIVNAMVKQLNSFAGEVIRVAREVGTEGKLGGQAKITGVSGTWKDLTDSVNSMASNLTAQVRNISEVTIAVANGDLSQKITVDVRGEILRLKEAINTMVDLLRSFAGEVTRVAREVGTEGKLGGQAVVPSVAGVWKDLTINVNFMAGNLTQQVRNIAEVTTAVAKGDLTRKITVDVKGEILELKNTINTMVDQLNAFAGEVTRVAREVGTEGKLGGQAAVKGVAGTWKDLTEGVNSMASNLTGQVRNIAGVTTAVAKGDLTKKITVEAKGEILELKNTINTMVDQLNAFSGEVTRVAREVGTEGKLGGQATVKGVAGTWRDLTESVNQMAANLTSQVRNIAQVTTAVANGDLSKKITVDVKGEILELKNTINTMVDQLNAFSGEVTRVAREVGTEGKLAGQAKVKGVAGTWKDLTDSVNSMADNLTAQVRNIAEVTTAVARGDLSKKITVEVKGEILELKNTVNTMVDQLSSFASEVTRMAREVGTDGKLGGQADVKGVAGTWKDLTDSVNQMAANLTSQVRNIAEVTTAVAKGDLSKKITVEVRGEILELKNTINTMVGQLNAFASEVTRVAREVGTEGKLGGQARVEDVSGTWKNLTDNVNQMATNLTDQVRGIVKVVTAVANGDLKQKLTVAAKGEVAVLSGTINNMTETLAIFAEQVSGVAKEVGVDGKLGGQAVVPGAAGTWMNLIDNVNQLADNLTTQVRAIAEVATAVTKGDLTRNITVQAKGEVEELKNNLNEMIRNLRDTTQTNTEQDWLKTNIAKFTLMLQGQRDLTTVAKITLSELALLVKSQYGIFYIAEEDEVESGNGRLRLLASYAVHKTENIKEHFAFGDGLVGQCAIEKQKIYLQNVPENYIKINSGLGKSAPLNILVLPIIFEGKVKAVLELGSFEKFNQTHQTFLEQLTETLGFVVNTIEATSRTEVLLKQSESFAKELQAQQEELQKTNKELEDQTRLLEEQKTEVERKNQEVEGAKTTLESKAQQLAITSKYKSEFLSNMSHELRTPLNSLLILAQQLRDNPEGNLTEKQVEFARTIFSSGNDLLSLINEILDLSKIESGTVSLDISDLQFKSLQQQLERMFRHVSDNKKLNFTIELDPNLPNDIYTDVKRVNQVLNNLLSNSFKFTSEGSVSIKIGSVAAGWSPENKKLNSAKQVIAFSVKDTGIGIPQDKLKIIFEAFQQADSGTARKFGGTGLGLAISREIATMLGGELTVESEVGKGSVFTLYLPNKYEAEPAATVPQSKDSAYPTLHEMEAIANETTQPRFHEPPGRIDVDPEKREVPDDRDSIEPTDTCLLVVEDDVNFARILIDIARLKGFKVLVAVTGNEAITLAMRYSPAAITLDIALPDMSGWKVFDIIKTIYSTAHIPIYVICMKGTAEAEFNRGEAGLLEKPVTREELEVFFKKISGFIRTKDRKLLLIDNPDSAKEIEKILGTSTVIKTAASESDITRTLTAEPVDSIVINTGLPGIKVMDIVSRIKGNPEWEKIPVIIQSERSLTLQEEKSLSKYHGIKLVNGVNTKEQMLYYTTLYMHTNVSNLPPEKARSLELIYQTHSPLAGKKVLIVDDDMRNIFALTALLERYRMTAVPAESGSTALKILQETPDIALVLMDIMMPEMDGYQTMQEIRKIPRLSKLPIIALTAKAMKGDREKCIEAGANEYVSKPVDTEKLLLLMRVILYK